MDAAEYPQEEPSGTEAIFRAMLRVKKPADGPNPVHERRVIIPRPGDRHSAESDTVVLSSIVVLPFFSNGSQSVRCGRECLLFSASCKLAESAKQASPNANHASG